MNSDKTNCTIFGKNPCESKSALEVVKKSNSKKNFISKGML